MGSASGSSSGLPCGARLGPEVLLKRVRLAITQPCFSSTPPPASKFAPIAGAGYPPPTPLEDQNLRIAIVIERFVPGAGGVENVAWQVAHELARQGEEITLITRDASTDTQLATEIVPVPTFWQPLRIGRFSLGAADRTRPPRFDVVHSFSHTRHQDLFRAGGGSQRDHLRRNFEGFARAYRHVSPRYRVRLDTERHVFERSSQRIQCSSSLVSRALMTDHGVSADRIFMLPNAVDAGAFSSHEAIAAGQQLRQDRAPTARSVWLFTGSGWHRKGLATALEAFAKGACADDRFWIAGRDESAPWQKRAHALGIADRVDFLGEWSEMPALYQAADALLLPTRYDPFANVTLEAAAAGLAIITSAGNGAAEWLGEAIQVMDEDAGPAEYAEAMKSLRNGETKHSRGADLARHARQYDWPHHVEALRKEYARIVSSRTRTAS